MSKIKYGYAWKCKKCGDIIALMFCDNFEPTICNKCGDRMQDLSYDEIREIDEKFVLYPMGAK